jgi:Ulp1 family protease
LNDVIIDAYACILKSETPQIAIISSYFVKNNIEVAEVNSTYFSKNINELQDYRLIGVPVNSGNLHWTLLIIDVQKKALIYLDSLTHSTTNRGQTIVAEMKRFLSSTYPEEFIDEEWTSIYPSTHALQQDSVNCGVFICYFLKVLTTAMKADEEVRISLLSRAPDIRRFREEIRTRICSHF